MFNKSHFSPFNLGLIAAAAVPLIGAATSLSDAQPNIEKSKQNRLNHLELIDHPERLNDPEFNQL
jgi:hypothetical protein